MLDLPGTRLLFDVSRIDRRPLRCGLALTFGWIAATSAMFGQ